MAKSKFQQYMLIGIGIMVAIGFSGVFTYGNMVNTPSSQNNQNQEVEAELPSENYIDGTYNLSIRQQAVLSVRNQVVFVNVLYEDSNENYTQLEGLNTEFNNKVYINAVNTSESAFASGMGAEAPSTLVVGNTPSRRQPFTIANPSSNYEDIKSSICSSMRDVSSFGATCYGN